MFGDMGKMMKQVMEMKSKMGAVENELKKIVIKGVSKDGSVETEITGKMSLKNIAISDKAPKDRKALEKAVFESVESALTQVTKVAQDKLSAVTGGMNIPGIS